MQQAIPAQCQRLLPASAWLAALACGHAAAAPWRTFEAASSCRGAVIWPALRRNADGRPLAPWVTPCPVQQRGTVEFDCSQGRLRYQQQAWHPGDWIKPVAGDRDAQNLQRACGSI